MVSDQIFTVAEAAEYLKLNPYTIRDLLRNGHIRGSKIKGYVWRIKLSDIDSYLEACENERRKDV